jgi:hypothetical protein
MHNQSNPVKTAKKQYQKPDFWVLDSYVEGGAGVNVHESTARTSGVSLPAHAGNSGQEVHKQGTYGFRSASWTAAHS